MNFSRHCDVCKDYRLETHVVHSGDHHNYRLVIWYCGITEKSDH